MHRTALFPAMLLAALPLAAAGAPDGQNLFVTHCSACHGADGKGAQEAFPPLAGSPWVGGDPRRAIKAVLHGLHGPIEVNGRKYDLEMQPLGTVLKDDEIASILTYVRSSWGNKHPAVASDEVKAVRSAYSKRSEAWTAAELLKDHPLELVAPPIKNLVTHIYPGEWKDFPDFSKLQPAAAEEEQDGLISESQADREQKYALLWTGQLVVPADGSFTFFLDADDAARLVIADQTVVEVRGGTQDGAKPVSKQVTLTKGDLPIRIEYYQRAGGRGIYLAMSGPGVSGKKLLSKPKAKPNSSIPVIPDSGEAIIYRNFIANVSPRAIGVGYDGGVNLAFDADALGVALVWTGAFMDGSRHWNGRGQGDQQPAGEQVANLGRTPAFAMLATPEAAWPAAPPESLPYRFRGYRMNAHQQPTFLYDLGQVKVTDQPAPVFSNKQRALQRTITFESPTALPGTLWMRLAQGKGLAAGATPTAFSVGGGATLKVDGAASAPVLRGSGQTAELLLPLTIGKGTTRIQLTYSW